MSKDNVMHNIYLFSDQEIINDQFFFSRLGSRESTHIEIFVLVPHKDRQTKVKVFGRIGGMSKPYRYGWLAEGPWIEDFYAIIQARVNEREAQQKAHNEAQLERMKRDREEAKALAEIYRDLYPKCEADHSVESNESV